MKQRNRMIGLVFLRVGMIMRMKWLILALHMFLIIFRGNYVTIVKILSFNIKYSLSIVFSFATVQWEWYYQHMHSFCLYKAHLALFPTVNLKYWSLIEMSFNNNGKLLLMIISELSCDVLLFYSVGKRSALFLICALYINHSFSLIAQDATHQNQIK